MRLLFQDLEARTLHLRICQYDGFSCCGQQYLLWRPTILDDARAQQTKDL